MPASNTDRAAVEEIKHAIDRSPSWRLVMSTNGRHYYKRRRDNRSIVIVLTQDEANVEGL